MWTYAISTKSNRAREYADEIAEAASRGFVTTLVAVPTPPTRAVYGRLWKLTPAGLNYLMDHGAHIGNMETQEYQDEHE